MHILMITLNLPRPGGGANTRDYYVLKTLASKHTVSLLAPRYEGLDDPVTISHLETLTHHLSLVRLSTTAQPKRWRQLLRVLQGQSYIVQSYIYEEIQQALDALFSTVSVDAVLFESVLMAGYRLPSNVCVMIDQHNLEYEILERTYQQEKKWLRRWYNQRESQLVKPIELERCRKADAIIVTSDRERHILQNTLPQQTIGTMPNGVDVDMFRPFPQGMHAEVPGRIVFTGSMNYYPNIQAALYFAHHCWPRIQQEVPGVSWQIVGREPPEEVRALAHLPGIEVTGSVPDVRPYLAEAAVTLAPLQIGGGTRLKILEALAMEKAMVSTSLGCEGLDVTPGKHLLVADQPEAFADAVISLLNDTKQRQQLGKAGRALAEGQYSWEQCGKHLLYVVDRLKEKEQIC